MQVLPRVVAAGLDMSTQRKVTRVDRSPMNAQRWCCTLDCGHAQWVTSTRKPTRKTLRCEHVTHKSDEQQTLQK